MRDFVKFEEEAEDVFGWLWDEFVDLKKLGLTTESLKFYFDNWSNGPVSLVDETGTLIFANTPLCRLTGYSKEELINHSITTISGEELGKIKNRIVNRKKGESDEYEVPLIKKTQERRMVRLSVRPIFTKSKQFIGSLAYVKDIQDELNAETLAKQSTESLESVVEKRTRALTISNYQMMTEIKERKLTEEALINSEKRFKDLFYNSPEAIFVEDFNGNVLDINEAGAILHGLSREQMLGKNIKLFCVDGLGNDFNVRQSKIVSGELSYFETEIIHTSKKTIPVAVKSAIIEFNGQLSVLLHARDITERIDYQKSLEQRNVELDEKVKERTAEIELTNEELKKEVQFRIQTQEAVNKQKDFLQMLIDINPNLVFVKDKESRFTLVNESYARFYGKSKEEILGKSQIDIIIDKTESDEFIGHDKLVLENPGKQFEFTVDKQGANSPNKSHLKIFKQAVQSVETGEYNVLGVALDLTEFRNNELQLKYSENLYRQIAGNVPNSAIFIFDKNLNYVLAEGPLIGTISLPKDQIEGKHISQIIKDPEELKATTEQYKHILEGASGVKQEEKDEKSFLINSTPIRNELGEVIYGLVVILEITELKKVQLALEENNLKLARSNEELERFAYVASHDLQSPLKTIISFLQLLEQRYGDKMGDDAKEFINYSVTASSRMRQLITDLLNYSRLNSVSRPYEQTDMNSLMFIVTRNLESNIETKNALIQYENLPQVFAEPYQITQLLQNLVDNAMKFVENKQPIVRVYATETEDYWQISVEDNGIGIKDEFKEKIFNIFQRLHNDSEYSGTGIGLAICKKVVDLHQGDIWIDSELGKGTTFHFTISKSLENKEKD